MRENITGIFAGIVGMFQFSLLNVITDGEG